MTPQTQPVRPDDAGAPVTNVAAEQRQATWTRPSRPAWVTAVNNVGAILGSPAAIVALDEASLLAAATELTGLHDFGDNDWREPFRILLSDIENEANLHLAGRLLTRFHILRSLVARLKMAEAEALNPEILERPVEAPIFITGMGRTGTTILHELLAQDPAFRATAGWELRYPSPPPTAEREVGDPRIANTAAEIEMWLELIPEFRPIHEMSVEGPDEDVVGQEHSFMSDVWSATHRAPNYEMWLAGSGMVAALRFHRRLLQHLQFSSPGRLLLKGPSHIACLPALFAEYPDAQVIMTHRDPIKVMASTANMNATLRWQRSDHVDFSEIVMPISFGLPYLMDMVMEQRGSGKVPNDRFIDVRYADLMADPVEAMRCTYEQLGMELVDSTVDRVRAHLKAKPKGRHGGHAYQFGDLGLDEAEVRAKFANYMEHHKIPEERL